MKSFVVAFLLSSVFLGGTANLALAEQPQESGHQVHVGDQLVYDIYWPQFLGFATVWVGTRTDTVTAVGQDGSLTVNIEADAHWYLNAVNQEDHQQVVYTAEDLKVEKDILASCAQHWGVTEVVEIPVNRVQFKACKISLPNISGTSGAEWYSDAYPLSMVKFEYDSTSAPNLIGYLRGIRKVSPSTSESTK